MDREKFLISLVMFFAFLIPLTAIYYVDAATDVKIQSNTINENENSSEKIKVAILGSSTVMPIDAEFIDEYILKNGIEVDVYNQSLSSDTPSRRLSVLDQTISEQPDIVLIGVDMHQFYDSVKSQTSSSNLQSTFYGCSKKLPEIQDLYFIMPINKEILGLVSDNFSNPKLSTLKLIYEFFNPNILDDRNSEEKYTLEKMLQGGENMYKGIPSDFKATLPSLTEKQSHGFDFERYRIIQDDEAIYKSKQKRGGHVEDSRLINPDGFQAIALGEIIERLQNEDIKVAIFSTPIYNLSIQLRPSCSFAGFELFMEELSTKYDITYYNFHYQFSDDDIWRDDVHIVHGEKGIDYSKAVAVAIQNEI